MGSREDILAAVRQHNVPPTELPDLDAPSWVTYADRRAQFAEVLQAAGGQCVSADDVAAVKAELAKMPVYAEATKVCSLVDGVGSRGVELASLDDPHQTHDIDLTIVAGQFAVAENGAVWLTDAAIKHRAMLFLSQHVALVVPAGEIVDNLHQAYARIEFNEPRFGIFISGPSKTADIEQSLVIGAHGPRSLSVFLVG